MRHFAFLIFSFLLMTQTTLSDAQAPNWLYRGADPYIIETDYQFGERTVHGFVHIYSEGRSLSIKAAPTLNGLKKPDITRRIWTAPEGWNDVWAPEITKIDGRYYAFFAACESAHDDFETRNETHRMYVIRGGTDATEGEKSYSPAVKMALEGDNWAIDGSALHFEGKWYFVWSGWPDKTQKVQHLYICTFDPKHPEKVGPKHLISTPTEKWESSPPLNEGPQGVTRDGRLLIVYSANGSWSKEYGLAYLVLKKGGDPLNPAHYAKPDSLRMKAAYYDDKSGLEGPGHCCFVLRDGSWDSSTIAYHAAPTWIQGDFWSRRQAYWNHFAWKTEKYYYPSEKRWEAGPRPIFPTMQPRGKN